MKQQIKRYILNDNLNENDLKKNGFRLSKYGMTSRTKFPRYYFISSLGNEIELVIEILISEDGKLMFDDFDNVLVLDDDFCQPYMPFYNESSFPFVNQVVKKYNQVMDDLVSCGILKEKELIKEEKGSSRYRK